MPIYEYFCEKCGKYFLTPMHLDDEDLSSRKCLECGEVGLKRVYGDFFVSQRKNVGKITRDAIEEAKKDLKDQKKETKKELEI